MAKDALRLEAVELAIQLSEQKLKEKSHLKSKKSFFRNQIKIIEERKIEKGQR